MIEKAVFLLRQAHSSREEAVHALAGYFPGAAFEDRLRCVHEAWDITRRNEEPAESVVSQVSDACSFAAAHARHAFTD